MKTYLKKVSALFIAFVMMLAMSVPAFAGNPGNNGYGQSDDRGKIEVKGIEAGATVEAYKIIRADYNNDGEEFSGYSLVTTYNSVGAPADGDWTKWATEANMTAIAKKIAENQVAKSYDMTWNETNQSYENDNVDIGAYLVLVKNAEGVYAPIVASVYYTYNEQTNENGVTETVLDITNKLAWAKVQTQPTIVKKILVDGTEVDGNTQNISGEVEYKVTVDIPSYTGNYPVFKISDTMTNLTYKDSFTMTASNTGKEDKVLVEGTDFTFTTGKNITTSADGKEFEVNFVVNNIFTLQQDYAGGTLTITYKATLDADDATVRNYDSKNAGNPNTVTLTYTTNSNVQESDKTVDDTVRTYTFKIEEGELVKVDSTNTEKVLKDAEFTLYTDEACTNVYKNGIITDGVVKSDESGNIVVDGLAAGTYYMKETKAPEGYALTNHVYKIVVAAEFTEENLETWSITVDDNKLDGNDVEPGKLEIKNTKDSELPSTGGMGTYLFTIVGVVIMAAAAGMLFMKRRGEAE